ncbi:hypothetical protein SAMN05216480_11017 [Pustulibacterium marinum]|uniref:Uncharacterized protein n=1 Tax=Pustulibacterium marinum TaxID=1224947 RepID=A0A1I7HLN5_9FLAO|nr:hypothetical protein [Pustulibacterium marinum]SFU61615.1 hypothetical protein SAMN05216480_11017 [Pustulibacterium marinum]
MALDSEHQKSGYRSGVQLPKGHEARFLARLEEELPQQKRTFSNYYWKVAAAVVLFFGVGTVALLQYSNSAQIQGTQVTVTESSSSENQSQPASDATPQITLGDLSPDLKKVEEYYIANINVELASLDVNDANKGMLEGYMQQLNDLNTEYKRLTKELNELGPNQQTVEALITNLQLRLQLLYRLKDRLEELKNTNDNGTQVG